MRLRRALVVFVVAVIGLNIGLRALQGSLGGGPGGPASSSFGTAPSGAAAYGELLRAAGHRVTRSRERPRDLRPVPAQTTLVLLDPGLVDDADAAALRRYLEQGGRLVVAGALRGGWLHELLDDPPEWSGDDLGRVLPLAPRSELAGIRDVAPSTAPGRRRARRCRCSAAGAGACSRSRASAAARRSCSRAPSRS